MKKHLPVLFSLTLVLVLALFAAGPALTTPVEEYAIDMATFHIYRAILFSDAQDHGAGYLARWSPTINGGLGGPLFNYAPPLMYYLIDGVADLGATHPQSWRVLVVLLLMAGALGMFGLALELTRRADAALVASVCFTYAPPLLRDVYERGSPQSLGVALCPWVLWAVLRLIRRPSGLRFAGAALSWGLLILAHNATALILAPLIGLFLVTLGLHYKIKTLLWPVLALAAGTAAAGCYVIPSLFEIDNVQIDNTRQVDYAYPPDNPTALADLLQLPPVFDTGIENNSMGKSIGLAQAAALLILPLLAAAWFKKGQRLEALLLAGMLVLSVLVIWLQTGSASWVWRAVPALDVLQFRFRLLILVGIVSALALGYALTQQIPGVLRGGLIAVLLAVLIGPQWPSLYVNLIPRQNDFSPLPSPAEVQTRILHDGIASLSSFNEFLPIWRHLPFTSEESQRASASPLANLPADAALTEVQRETRHWSIRIDTPQPFTAAFHLLYYPGWVARVDGERQDARPATDQTGYLLLDIPAGSHTVTLDFEGTRTQQIGNWITLLTAALLAGLALWWRPSAAHEPLPRVTYPAPRWALVIGIVALAGFKLLWIDPDTSFLRRTSECDAIYGADRQVQVVLDGEFRLCGYEISKEHFAPGDRLELTLYWMVDQHPERQVSSFVHVLGTAFNPATNNPLWGQQDKLMPGDFWTSQWKPHRLYRDAYEINIPSNTPAGTYWVEVGMYSADGTRLVPVITGSPGLDVSDLDALLLVPITVKP